MYELMLTHGPKEREDRVLRNKGQREDILPLSPWFTPYLQLLSGTGRVIIKSETTS